MAEGVKQHLEHKTVHTSLKNLKGDLEKLKMTRKEDSTRIEEEKQKIRRKMQDNVLKLKNKLDNLLKTSDMELERKFNEFKGDIDQDLKELEETISKVNQSSDGLQKEDDREVFIEMKTNKHIQKQAQKTIQNISRNARREALKFTVDPAINIENLASKSKLGDLTFENDNLPARRRLFHESCEYDATLQGTYNVNINNDPKPCHILDSCLLSDGSIVLTDLPHNLVLHLDQMYNIKSSRQIPGAPWGVCSTSSTDIAVTLIGSQMVQLVSIGTRLDLKNSFKVGIPCRGIFFKDGHLYVCCGGGSNYWRSIMEGSGQVRVYSLQGALLKTFLNDDRGKFIFGRPRDIVLNPHNNLFYITDETHGVISITRSGQKVAMTTDKNLTAARGISFDTRGLMFVGCFKSNQVLLFDQDRHFIQIPITKQMAEISVRSLCFLADTYRLVVTSESDEIRVFDLARR